MSEELKTFETQNVDLATFLIIQGIKFLGCKKNPNNSKVAVLMFEDSRQNCLDLERVFLSSEFKKYRDINKWLLGKVHDVLRQN